jgi:hypothetical protein
MTDLNMIDWSDLQQVSLNEDTHCGGPNGCEGRKFDSSKKDCQDCLAEAGAEDE